VYEKKDESTNPAAFPHCGRMGCLMGFAKALTVGQENEDEYGVFNKVKAFVEVPDAEYSDGLFSYSWKHLWPDLQAKYEAAEPFSKERAAVARKAIERYIEEAGL